LLYVVLKLFLVLREKHRSQISQNEMHSKIFRPKGDENRGIFKLPYKEKPL
jgi:hypothetical protein